MKNNGRRNESLCEMSMKMATNMVKLSSLTISKVSLGIKSATTLTSEHLDSVVVVLEKPRMPLFTGSQLAKDLHSKTKPTKYIVEPVAAGNRTPSVIFEDNNVDGKASDYIRKVHEKIRGSSYETSQYAYKIPPPPPPPPQHRVLK